MINEQEQVVEQDVQPEAAQTDVKKEASSTSQPDTQQDGAEKPVTGERLPFNKDPEVQRYIDRQVSKREQAFTKQMQELKDDYVKRLEKFNDGRVAQGKPEVNQLPPDQEQALLQLAEMMFGHKTVREKYGLDKVSEIEKKLTASSSEAEKQVYESEMESTVNDYASKFGYDKDELREDIEEFIQNDPWFADKSFHKGSVQKAAKLFFSEKSQELAERAANLKLIKEQKEKKQVTTESTSTGSKGRQKVSDKNLDSYLDRRIQDEGGIKFD
jgi:hypothetical protein